MNIKKNILIIGGSYGIGHAIVSKLMPTHNIYVASRTVADLVYLNVTHIPFNALTDELNTALLPEQIDGFVYCPGSIELKPFKRLKMDVFQHDLQINYISLVKVVQTLLPFFNKANPASLVFFSSIAASVGMPFHTSIAGAKAAVEGFAKALAAEYAPNMRVNVIAPSITNTPLASKLLSNEQKIEKLSERHPLKRIGNVDDMANIAAFLLQEESNWITGQVIGVDGGLSTLNVN
jgi:NAD(P)-dependent dehydrogenase (short-subunit alcohol dehydrogenase family)